MSPLIVHLYSRSATNAPRAPPAATAGFPITFAPALCTTDGAEDVALIDMEPVPVLPDDIVPVAPAVPLMVMVELPVLLLAIMKFAQVNLVVFLL